MRKTAFLNRHIEYRRESAKKLLYPFISSTILCYSLGCLMSLLPCYSLWTHTKYCWSEPVVFLFVSFFFERTMCNTFQYLSYILSVFICTCTYNRTNVFEIISNRISFIIKAPNPLCILNLTISSSFLNYVFMSVQLIIAFSFQNLYLIINN
jgi:hypothetical protein